MKTNSIGAILFLKLVNFLAVRISKESSIVFRLFLCLCFSKISNLFNVIKLYFSAAQKNSCKMLNYLSTFSKAFRRHFLKFSISATVNLKNCHKSSDQLTPYSTWNKRLVTFRGGV